MIDILAHADQRIAAAKQRLHAAIDLRCSIERNRMRVGAFIREQEATAEFEFFSIRRRTRDEIVRGVPPHIGKGSRK